jgi:hypothetical protein
LKVFLNLQSGVTRGAVPEDVDQYKKQAQRLRIARRKDRQLIKEQRHKIKEQAQRLNIERQRQLIKEQRQKIKEQSQKLKIERQLIKEQKQLIKEQRQKIEETPRTWSALTSSLSLTEWEERGKPIPPPHVVKQRVLREYAEEYHLRVLVETGTQKGAMIEAMKHHFDEIYSIELSEELFQRAKKRFASEEHIELIHGDSGKELKRVLERINQPALFWLDGHFSGDNTARGEKDTPILEELTHILNAQGLNHVVVIDDARHFGRHPSYPSIEELKELVNSRRGNLRITVEDDIIRIVPVSVLSNNT